MLTNGIQEYSPSNQTNVMQRHPLLSFFFLAYAISWAFMVPYVLSAWGIIPGDYFILEVLHTFGPAFAAIIVIGRIEGTAGLRSFRHHMKQRRAGRQWFFFVLVGIPALILFGIIIQPGVLASFQGLPSSILVTYPAYFFITFFGGGPLGEEPGWRGFALPRLQPRYGPLNGTLLLGVLWGFWHLPDYLMPNYQGMGSGTGLAAILTNFPPFVLMVVAFAVIFTWVFNRTHENIFVAIVMHTSFNCPQVVWIPLFLAVDVTSMFLGQLAVFGILALLIIVQTRGQLGYQSNHDLSKV
jgi:membrane protease YdiL (CAAX protease family)